MITCTFTGENTGNAGDVFNDRITVTGKDEANRDVEAYAEATVNLTNVQASITIVKEANPITVAEPGGNVLFTFTITNTSTVDSVTIDTLVDTIYGNLALKPTCDAVIGVVLAPNGGSTQCSFTAMVTGNAGDTHTNVVTVTGHTNDEADGTLTANDDATVRVTDVLPLITVVKDANPTSVPENNVGALVTFTVSVTNDSVESVTLTTLNDDVFGNIANPANPNITNSTCDLIRRVLAKVYRPGPTTRTRARSTR